MKPWFPVFFAGQVKTSGELTEKEIIRTESNTDGVSK
jgi:hypothetical protein